MHYDEFLIFKKELLRKPNQPYHMSNENLADEFYKEIKEIYPNIKYFKFDSQWFCLNDKAIKNLRSFLMKRLHKEEDELRKIVTFMHEVEQHIGSN